MPRKKLTRQNIYSYHVISRSNHKDWFSISLNETWVGAINALLEAYIKHPVMIQAFTLMNSHYHLILRTPDSNLDSFMYEFNKRFSLFLRLKTNKINRMFGGRYRWTLIQNNNYFYNAIKYVYQNPLRVGLVNNCEEFPFSDLYYRWRKLDFILELDNPLVMNQDTLNWINDRFSESEEKMWKKGIRRTVIDQLRLKDKLPPHKFTLPSNLI